ncbi:MAG: Ribose-5-phosphate isomerase A [Methanonatronarchaeales archaeon]|nr:Ribose-5-phosphate isomerase A [Methanonatronarchaeales archaeon]
MDLKRAAGRSAAELVRDGDVVGLGTGSTAAAAIEAIGRRVEEESLDVTGIPTSYQSRWLAVENGVPLTTLDRDTPDVAIDGADQVDSDLYLVKGGGAAHALEKIVDEAADRFVVVADQSKLRDPLDHPVPLEVMPDAHRTVEDAVREMGGSPRVRLAERKDGPVITDNGNLVVDADLGEITDPAATARKLDLPGVVEHGIFPPPDEVHVATEEGVEIRRP